MIEVIVIRFVDRFEVKKLMINESDLSVDICKKAFDGQRGHFLILSDEYKEELAL